MKGRSYKSIVFNEVDKVDVHTNLVDNSIY